MDTISNQSYDNYTEEGYPVLHAGSVDIILLEDGMGCQMLFFHCIK